MSASAIAHELLNIARDEGSNDQVWDTKIFPRLRECPAALVRPEPRKFSLLHQAAFWGSKAAAETLLEEFGADPLQATADEHASNAAGVAEWRKHPELAVWLRAQVAPSPYLRRQGGAGNPQVEGEDGSVRIWLCLRGAGGEQRWTQYAPSEQAQIEAAQATGSGSVELGTGTLHFEAMEEQASGGSARSPASCVHVLWEWDAGEGGKAAPVWRPYRSDVQWQLDAALCAADESAEVRVAEGQGYIVDLVGLRQFAPEDSFRCRRVRRRGAMLSERFPAKVRDVHTGQWLDLASIPHYWGPCAAVVGEGQARRSDLPRDSPIFEHICSWMNMTIRGGHNKAFGRVAAAGGGDGGATRGMEVVRVEVVQETSLWRRYCCYKGKLKTQAEAIKEHPGTAHLKENPMQIPICEWLDQDVCEAYFWHGSGKSPDGAVDVLEKIVSGGHQQSDENASLAMEVADGACGRFAKVTSMFGAGVYLADISSKANLYVPCPVCHQGAYFRAKCECTKERVDAAEPYRMLLCRAAMGRVYVDTSYQETRYKGNFNPAKELGVDSVMGEVGSGKLAFREYIVYNDSASYPEFIVHYRRHPKAL